MKSNKKQPTDSDLIGSQAALRRAAKRALEIAKQTHTPCYVVRDGQIVDIAAEAEEASLSESLDEKRTGSTAC